MMPVFCEACASHVLVWEAAGKPLIHFGAETHRGRPAVDLFTPDEHAILAEWFSVKSPALAEDIMVGEAISKLGFDNAPDLYRRIDAAVAFIVLERAEQRLPQWSAIRDDEVNAQSMSAFEGRGFNL
jgi:hypothetical protein